jgi:hypothetical protein
VSPRRNKPSDDPFSGLRLPMSVWRALVKAQIATLDQLKAAAARIETVPGIDPESAHIIKDRLERMASKRTVRVRLIFPKRLRRKRSSDGP